MNRVLNQLLKLPLEFVVESMDLVLKTMRQFQVAFNEAADQTTEAGSLSFDNPEEQHRKCSNDQTEDHVGKSVNEEANETQNLESIKTMYEDNDKDLSGDDIKYVSYSILFKKRDYEATLQQEREEIVDYSTDGASFGAVKISEYTDQFGTTAKVPIPAAWRGNEPQEIGYGFHDNGGVRCFRDIPAKDRKHLRFVYCVKNRIEKEKANYDRDQVNAIRDVTKTLREIFE